MSLHVTFQFLGVLESNSTHITGEGLVFGVCSPDVAVVGGMRCERFPAVFALERPLTGVLPDVCAENAGRRESLRQQVIHVYTDDKFMLIVVIVM